VPTALTVNYQGRAAADSARLGFLDPRRLRHRQLAFSWERRWAWHELGRSTSQGPVRIRRFNVAGSSSHALTFCPPIVVICQLLLLSIVVHRWPWTQVPLAPATVSFERSRHGHDVDATRFRPDLGYQPAPQSTPLQRDHDLFIEAASESFLLEAPGLVPATTSLECQL